VGRTGKEASQTYLETAHNSSGETSRNKDKVQTGKLASEGRIEPERLEYEAGVLTTVQ
jgi:hypothetical protein